MFNLFQVSPAMLVIHTKEVWWGLRFLLELQKVLL